MQGRKKKSIINIPYLLQFTIKLGNMNMNNSIMTHQSLSSIRDRNKMLENQGGRKHEKLAKEFGRGETCTGTESCDGMIRCRRVRQAEGEA